MSDLPDRLAGAPLVYDLPRLLSERWDVVLAGREGKPSHRVLAGALGLCVQRIRRRISYKGDVIEFGGYVIEMLLNTEQPATMAEIITAGSQAFRLIDESLVSQPQVDAATKNSEPPEVPS